MGETEKRIEAKQCIVTTIIHNGTRGNDVGGGRIGAENESDGICLIFWEDRKKEVQVQLDTRVEVTTQLGMRFNGKRSERVHNRGDRTEKGIILEKEVTKMTEFKYLST